MREDAQTRENSKMCGGFLVSI